MEVPQARDMQQGVDRERLGADVSCELERPPALPTSLRCLRVGVKGEPVHHKVWVLVPTEDRLSFVAASCSQNSLGMLHRAKAKWCLNLGREGDSWLTCKVSIW